MIILTAILWVLSMGLIGGLDAGANFSLFHGIIFGLTLLCTVYYLVKED